MAPSAITATSVPFARPRFQKTQYEDDESFADSLKSWPVHIHSPLAWEGATFKSEAEYTYLLSPEEKLEVNEALAYFKAQGLDGSEISAVNFPLPNMGTKLLQLTRQLHESIGFFVVRGLNPEEYSQEDNILIFLGVSSYVGEKRGKQDEEGSMLMHIREAKKMAVDQELRPARDSNASLKFHSDLFCDILALQTRGCADVGGNHIITSGYKVYNELVAIRPDLVEVLARPDWNFDPRSLHAKPEQRSLLFYHDGRIILNYGRNRILGNDDPSSRKLNGIPTVTPLQMEALELLEELGVKYQLELPMQLGDLTFINNFGILHSRDAFQDSEANVRYLVRMWIKNEALSWSLPPVLAVGNEKTYGDETDEVWNILPAPRVKFDVRDRFSP